MIPPEEAVAAAARVLYETAPPKPDTWDTAPPFVRAVYMEQVLPLIAAAFAALDPIPEPVLAGHDMTYPPDHVVEWARRHDVPLGLDPHAGLRWYLDQVCDNDWHATRVLAELEQRILPDTADGIDAQIRDVIEATR